MDISECKFVVTAEAVTKDGKPVLVEVLSLTGKNKKVTWKSYDYQVKFPNGEIQRASSTVKTHEIGAMVPVYGKHSVDKTKTYYSL